MSLLMGGVEVEPDTRPGGLGILDAALPAPAGWAQGLSIPFYGCGEPVLMDRCVDAHDVPHRTAVAEFMPYGISQGATCSSLSRLDQKAHAEGRLDSTTEWAVARQLATDALNLGTPSFADGVSLGTIADGDFVHAVGVLEQSAADAGFGAQWWLHAPILAASYLTSKDLVNGDGLSPSLARWVISPGYPVQGTTTVRLWATGPVWVGVDDAFVIGDLDRTNNDDTAYAQRSAIAAFDPCVNLFIDVTVPVSPVIGSE
jgi:hypothetical protein